MAILAEGASYKEFCRYVTDLKGPLGEAELEDLWAWRTKLLGLRFNTGRGERGSLPPDEQHLTREQRGKKSEAEAKAAGRNIERLPDKAYF